VNFTREPIIETVITPREGCKLVVRSSKANGQEDYFVDAVEVVSFGHSFFFRSSEKPKSFLVPVSDYEILELRETRMVLKHVPTERSVKIGGGRDSAPPRQPREAHSESRAEPKPEKEVVVASEAGEESPAGSEAAAGSAERSDRNKRDRSRRRGRRGRTDRGPEASTGAVDANGEPVPLDSQSEASDASPTEEKIHEEKPLVPIKKNFIFPVPPSIFKPPVFKSIQLPEVKSDGEIVPELPTAADIASEFSREPVDEPASDVDSKDSEPSSDKPSDSTDETKQDE
jgi:hypothetical protein